MAKLTAIEWFFNEFENKFYASQNAITKKIQINIDPLVYSVLKNKVKSMEKEQIIMAYHNGYSDAIQAEPKQYEPEQYYNETYKK
jgi:hypothetical protein